ncbi:YozE family protein [Vagococcus entomophilus]|uniref:UPF0346 protein CBF30_02450 n=1 Tax=Vagococcus entomophilus TaxID=1160095 RepID=A0A430AJ52_9ENTE|nr:YozE family protein [Vagococcus entomophilus]RSU08125.1 hypothetical protein CBF30_02450 [Vagococcus entomophilus]
MNRSFYEYLMTLKGPNISEPETKFANDVGEDLSFPKHSKNYQEISHYLEFNAYYIDNMDLFDEVWEQYVENNA